MAATSIHEKSIRRIECLSMIVTKDGKGFYCRKSGGPCTCPDSFRRHLLRK
ncbi:hypothetical protein [[Eubacterium] cellulosolvens]